MTLTAWPAPVQAGPGDHLHFEVILVTGPISMIEVVITQEWVELHVPGPVAAIDRIIPVSIDIYTTNPSDPVVSGLPGYYSEALFASGTDCINQNLCVRPRTGLAVPVSLVGSTAPPLFLRGEGCMKIYYRDGSTPTIVDDIPVVTPALALPGGACP